MSIRLLTQDDFEIYDAFLTPHTVTAMFLRSNARKVGMDYKDERYHGHYYGAFDKGKLTGVIGLNQNGNVMVQAHNRAQCDELLYQARKRHPGYVVMGLLGPHVQCEHILKQHIMPPPERISMSVLERAYKLSVERLRVPPKPPGAVVRYATDDDAALLAEWSRDYKVETLGSRPSDLESMAESVASERRFIATGNAMIMTVDGAPVAKANFNGRVPDTVQFGGVYTPPELRGRGYAKAVVAGAIQLAKAEGVTNAVLFTKNPWAMKAYEAIGFEYAADYHLTLLRPPGIAL